MATIQVGCESGYMTLFRSYPDSSDLLSQVCAEAIPDSSDGDRLRPPRETRSVRRRSSCRARSRRQATRYQALVHSSIPCCVCHLELWLLVAPRAKWATAMGTIKVSIDTETAGKQCTFNFAWEGDDEE